MPQIIISDENEGRRNLLANTLEREGFDVTRGSTLRQTEATALATMPEVVVIDDEWKSGDALDAAQRMMSDPEFAFKCRIVMLTRNIGQENMIAAAKAGIHEVLGKPLNMNKLIEQLWKHSKKQFVPPPAKVDRGGTTEGGFSLSLDSEDGSIALPMLANLLGPDTINEEFVSKLTQSLSDANIEFGQDIEFSTLSEVLKIALNQLVMGDGYVSDDEEVTYDSVKSSPKLGTGAAPSEKGKRLVRGGTMEEILQNQADAIAADVEKRMDEIFDEIPPNITFPNPEDYIPVEPEVLKMTKLAVDYTHDLLWSLGRPDAVVDITLMTQIENATEMMGDVLTSITEIDMGDEEEQTEADPSEEE
jgi:CheY-like chemotaxis protein